MYNNMSRESIENLRVTDEHLRAVIQKLRMESNDWPNRITYSGEFQWFKLIAEATEENGWNLCFEDLERTKFKGTFFELTESMEPTEGQLEVINKALAELKEEVMDLVKESVCLDGQLSDNFLEYGEAGALYGKSY